MSYSVITEFRNEVMPTDSAVEFLASTYLSCVLWDGINSQVVSGADSVREFLDGKYCVEVHHSVAGARRNQQALCQVTVDRPWSEWVEAR